MVMLNTASDYQNNGLFWIVRLTDYRTN